MERLLPVVFSLLESGIVSPRDRDLSIRTCRSSCGLEFGSCRPFSRSFAGIGWLFVFFSLLGCDGIIVILLCLRGCASVEDFASGFATLCKLNHKQSYFNFFVFFIHLFYQCYFFYYFFLFLKPSFIVLYFRNIFLSVFFLYLKMIKIISIYFRWYFYVHRINIIFLPVVVTSCIFNYNHFIVYEHLHLQFSYLRSGCNNCNRKT